MQRRDDLRAEGLELLVPSRGACCASQKATLEQVPGSFVNVCVYTAQQGPKPRLGERERLWSRRSQSIFEETVWMKR